MEDQSSSLENFLTTKELLHCSAHIWKTPFKADRQTQFPIQRKTFQCDVIQQKSDAVDGMVIFGYYMYAFASNQEMQSQVFLYSFEKAQGYHKTLTIGSFYPRITCLKFIQNKDQFLLAIGFNQGLVKFVDLKEGGSVKGLQLQVKPVKMIVQGSSNSFSQQSVCFVLTIDSTIHLVHIQQNQVMMIFRPQVISCDRALSISLSHGQQYLLQTTEGGYLAIWKLESIYSLFIQKITKKNKKQQTNISKQTVATTKQSINTSKQQEKTKSQPKNYQLFPVICTHTLTIEGFIWCDFYGHLLMFITKQGWLKIVALELSNNDEFTVLMITKIQQPQEIAGAKLLATKATLLIGRNTKSNCRLQNWSISQYLNIQKVVKTELIGLNSMQEFHVVENQPVIVCRGRKSFAATHDPSITVNKNTNKNAQNTAKQESTY